ncbi:LppU/SCO3897 family protein [Nucisporomicrobium flavum]|uniref:LppU/SCO3897 family protein n=1 Tax=Nucisporomicrobium flavum TaxID=2785915 RepID=UPI0018F3337F|nr:porin [Nucisporomicrobium flavum]
MNKLLGVALLAALLGVLVLTVFRGGDEAADAAVGDCLAAPVTVRVGEDAEADAKVVGCGSAYAAYTVVGRLDGQSDPRTTACETYFQANEEYFVYSSTAGDGYLLCLARRR